MRKYAETASKICGNGSNMRKYGEMVQICGNMWKWLKYAEIWGNCSNMQKYAEIKAARSTSNGAKHANIHIFQLKNHSKYICKYATIRALLMNNAMTDESRVQ